MKVRERERERERWREREMEIERERERDSTTDRTLQVTFCVPPIKKLFIVFMRMKKITANANDAF